MLEFVIYKVARRDPDNLLFLFHAGQITLHHSIHKIFRQSRCYLKILLKVVRRDAVATRIGIARIIGTYLLL